ncbi:response regulator [Desulfuromonas thiophila]|jgi:DNA-binding NtrC family response regulator|uniref:Response regulator receiver domain-containing protein n=1 Tax=Desulfuromonas thiophila TaxID=57664 RepID=A0A1G6Y141_9BACT|nr:response regulator [Desulfuromonas thiophila]MCK9173008.1 response regulator [Desulfuromonas thiophila]MDD3801872.1 response regulator [Desulfuromonas thiophila]MDY0397126.1 response regulator [Desulfuromonas thiophila]SDD83345.1 hypothetical protein SAMN05661003_101451 [Desulfuromonas thiophila]
MNPSLDVIVTRPAPQDDAQAERLRQLVIKSGGHPIEVRTLAEAVTALRQSAQPLVLLSEQFDGSSALELIGLLRQCNKQAKIILLADTDNVSFLRQARSAGIFYHALEPRSEEDAQELLLALDSAAELCREQQQERRLWHRVADALS